MGTVVIVNDQEFSVGKASAAQVSGIARILSRIGSAAGKGAQDLSDGDYLSVIAAIVGAVDEDELVSLAALCIGSDEKFAKDNFDLVWVTEALAVLIEETNLDAVIKNFMRIASRFQQ